MLVGVCQFECLFPDSSSLKEKRIILNSIKARIRNKFNVSIAEVDYHDLWQRSVIGISMISNEKKPISQAFNKIFEYLDNQDRLEIIDHKMEIY